MADIHVRQGYNLKLVGKPLPQIIDAEFPQYVALRPSEFERVKFRVLVKEGERLKTGSPILENKARPEIKFTAPVSGVVEEIRRGERRVLLHILVRCDTQEQFVDFGAIDPQRASRDEIRDRLLRSGLFPRIRQHPFERLANPNDVPKGIFVSALATAPLAPDPNVMAKGNGDALNVGFAALAKLTDGRVHLGKSANPAEVAPELNGINHVEHHEVKGKHPAGNPVVQAFYVDRVKPGEVIWYLDVQDVIAIGRLFQTGRLSGERVVALAGGGVRPEARKYYRTRLGALATSLTTGRLAPGENRVISGDVLTGRQISEDSSIGFYDNLLTVIPEGRRREWFGWMMPGLGKYSYSRAFLSSATPNDREWSVDTNLHGGHRACIQCGYCNEVCPTDVLCLPTWKAASYGDIEEAETLGIQDCVSCGLCTYVCPSKIEIDDILKQGLVEIQKEG